MPRGAIAIRNSRSRHDSALRTVDTITVSGRPTNTSSARNAKDGSATSRSWSVSIRAASRMNNAEMSRVRRLSLNSRS
jgi:hypothetical protein